MATLIVFDLISALVDTFTDVVPAGVSVYDGQTPDEATNNFLMVGVGDTDAQAASTAASGALEWAGLGHRSSYETGSITCVAVAWSGDVGNGAARAVRESVRDIWTVVEAELRSDPGLSGVVPGLTWVTPAGSFDFDQLSATDGVAALFRFEIAYKARLTV